MFNTPEQAEARDGAEGYMAHVKALIAEVEELYWDLNYDINSAFADGMIWHAARMQQQLNECNEIWTWLEGVTP